MKSRKEIKEKASEILWIVFGHSGRTLWFMSIVGGFFVANLRQNGRLTLINRDAGSITQTYDGDYEFYEGYNENLCGAMFRKFQEDEFKLGIKTGRITREMWDKQQKIREKEIEKYLSRLNSDIPLEERINWEKINDEPPVVRFVRSCETTLEKTAKSGFWWTVGVWSIFSWIGLKIARDYEG